MSCYSVTLQTLLPSLSLSHYIFLSDSNNVCLTFIFPLTSTVPPFTENLILMQQTMETAAELFQISLTDHRFPMQLDHLKSQVSALPLSLS